MKQRMPRSNVLAGPLLAATAAAALTGAAQADTLRVGPSGAFAQINTAVAASQPGDTIIVEPGTYVPFTASHALRVIGDGTGPVVIGFVGTNGVTVSNLPAGAEFVLSGVEVRTNTLGAAGSALVRLDANAGTVVLHDVLVQGAFAGVGLRVTNCASVVVTDSRILDSGPYISTSAGGAIESSLSTLLLADCTVTGDVGGGGAAEPGDHALVASGGRVELWRSSLRGGDGSSGKGFLVTSNGGDGLRALNAVVANYGGPGSELVGGDAGASGPFGAPGQGGAGITAVNFAVVRTQALVPVQGGFDLAHVVQTSPIVTDAGSSALAFGAVFASIAGASPRVALGGTASIEVDGNPGATVALFIALRTGPRLELPGVAGTGVLDLTNYFQSPPFTLDALGEATSLVGLPFPWLVDQTIWFQAVEINGSQLTITNPAMVVVTP
jgi:hypothetical protein